MTKFDEYSLDVILGDDNTDTEFPATKFAISALTAWLIPRLYITWRRSVVLWQQSAPSTSIKEAGTQRLNRCFYGTVTILTCLLWGTSALIANFTLGLNPNMVLILAGLSRLVSSGVMFLISLETPQWLGVYDYLQLFVMKPEPIVNEELLEESRKRIASEDFDQLPPSKHTPVLDTVNEEDHHNDDDDDDHDDEQDDEQDNEQREQDEDKSRTSKNSSIAMMISNTIKRAKARGSRRSLFSPQETFRLSAMVEMAELDDASTSPSMSKATSMQTRPNITRSSTTSALSSVPEDGGETSTSSPRRHSSPQHHVSSGTIPTSRRRRLSVPPRREQSATSIRLSDLEGQTTTTGTRRTNASSTNNVPMSSRNRIDSLGSISEVQEDQDDADDTESLIGHVSLKVVTFDLFWHIFGEYLRLSGLLLMFAMDRTQNGWWLLPVVYGVGILLGLALVAMIYFGRTRLSMRRNHQRQRFSYIVMFCFVVFSCLAFAFGCHYIQSVWRPDVARFGSAMLLLFSFFLCLIFELAVHWSARRLSKKQLRKKEEARQAGLSIPEDFYKTEYFEVNSNTPSSKTIGSSSFVTTTNSSFSNKSSFNSGKASETSYPRDPSTDENGRIFEVVNDNENTADTRVIAQNADSIIIVPEEETSNEIGDASLFLQQANPQDDVPGMVSSDFEEATDLPEEVQELPIDLNLRQEEQENVETQQMVDMIPPSLGQDEDGSSYADDQDVDKEPSIVQLLIAKLGIGCCFCCCGNSFATQQEGYFYGLSTWGIIWLIFRWLLRFVGQGLSMYMIIVNIGATQQGNYAIQKFPTVHGILYEGQNEGPVCAYLEPWIDETTRTFPNATTATMEGYEIAHCGACAACSTWHNLELQWSTRNNLAILSNKCAKKQIFGGYEKALDCHLDTIGFDIPCSNCWIDVEACAIHHCSFIQMQAWIIANLGNFEVGPDVVTAAMCEEATCEVDFVPCSGANRRRMNIVSDIARPGKQQCELIPESNVKWYDLFGPEDPFLG